MIGQSKYSKLRPHKKIHHTQKGGHILAIKEIRKEKEINKKIPNSKEQIKHLKPEKKQRGKTQTRKAMYVKRNIEAQSCNHICCGKAVSIIYCEWQCLALVTQHAIRMCRITCHLRPARFYSNFLEAHK